MLTVTLMQIPKVKMPIAFVSMVDGIPVGEATKERARVGGEWVEGKSVDGYHA